ncbi:hypothetical protein [Caldovatus aquaticus]|uniref:Uncharacterized protein n=1 Tax=Caldovatus aquaticus TaxID=2865671 RepID=A0ABS7F1Q5_9PROT|nr:hypothetical protein [Caldovatus aquaticus]MBW8269555.1 hypothetical protein [Caldovatus aquaticus]
MEPGFHHDLVLNVGFSITRGPVDGALAAITAATRWIRVERIGEDLLLLSHFATMREGVTPDTVRAWIAFFIDGLHAAVEALAGPPATRH